MLKSLFGTSKNTADKPQFVVGDYPHLPCINIKDLHNLKPVGSGGQADVFRVDTKMLGTCAYKEFFRPIELIKDDGKRINPCVSSSTEGEKNLIRELTYSLEVSRHPNIILVHAYASEFDDENLPIKHKGILMEFMENGSLSKYLYSYNKNPDSGNWNWVEPKLQMNDANAWPRRVDKWALQIARALAFCHEAFKLIHRDVKPENILLSSDFETAKLADFGIARKSLKSDGPPTSGTGTEAYMAPEVHSLDATANYSFEADVFSYGCLLYAMTTQKGPFEEKEKALKPKTEFFKYLEDDKNRPPLSTNPEYTKLNEVIKQCWKANPKKRWAMEYIVQYLDQTVENE